MGKGQQEMNGNLVKVLLTVLVLSLGAIGSLIVLGADDLKDGMKRVDDQVDTLENRVDKVVVEQALTTIQLSEITKGINRISDADIPVVLDTAYAQAVIAKDTL